MLLRLGDVALDAKDVLSDCLFDEFRMFGSIFLDLLNDALEIVVFFKLVVVCVGNDDVVESG